VREFASGVDRTMEVALDRLCSRSQQCSQGETVLWAELVPSVHGSCRCISDIHGTAGAVAVRAGRCNDDRSGTHAESDGTAIGIETE